MPSEQTIPHTAFRNLIIPFSLILLICISLIAGLMVYAARHQDQMAAADSLHLTRSALSTKKDQLASLTLDYSYWNEAVENLVTRLDPDWADANIGSYLHETFAVTASYILAADDRVIYGMVDGERRQEDVRARFPKSLAALTRRARATPPDKPPEPVTGLMRDGDAVFLAAERTQRQAL